MNRRWELARETATCKAGDEEASQELSEEVLRDNAD